LLAFERRRQRAVHHAFGKRRGRLVQHIHKCANLPVIAARKGFAQGRDGAVDRAALLGREFVGRFGL